MFGGMFIAFTRAMLPLSLGLALIALVVWPELGERPAADASCTPAVVRVGAANGPEGRLAPSDTVFGACEPDGGWDEAVTYYVDGQAVARAASYYPGLRSLSRSYPAAQLYEVLGAGILATLSLFTVVGITLDEARRIKPGKA